MVTKESAIKILKGAGLAGGGAALTYLVGALPGVDLGTWGPLVGAVLSVLLNLVRKLIKERGETL